MERREGGGRLPGILEDKGGREERLYRSRGAWGKLEEGAGGAGREGGDCPKREKKRGKGRRGGGERGGAGGGWGGGRGEHAEKSRIGRW